MSAEVPEPVRPAPEGPEEGHRFRFTVHLAGSSHVVGDPEHHDSEMWGEPWTVEVRAWSLAAAVVKLQALELRDWLPDLDDAPWADYPKDL